MATTSKLQASIKLLHGDKEATLASLTASFHDDYSHFATANNREALNQAVGELKKSPKDRGIADAISEAYKAGGLTVGYIGARTGKFASQPADVQVTFNAAIDAACEAFNASLTACEAFADKLPKTSDEKAKAKEAKEEKAKEAKDALITSMVQSGELVRSVDVKKLEDFAQSALIEALKIQGVDVEGLQAALAALQADHAALQADHAALQASKAVKPQKAKA